MNGSIGSCLLDEDFYLDDNLWFYEEVKVVY